MTTTNRISSISIYFVQFVLFAQISFAFIAVTAADDIKWKVEFEPNTTTVHMNGWKNINVTLSELNTIENLTNATISVISNADILQVSKEIPINEIKNGRWSGQVRIDAVFIGNASVFVEIEHKGKTNRSRNSLPVVIIREERVIDKIFVVSVIALVSILYINFGAALDLQKVKGVLMRPIGPGIAFFCHFIFLPLVIIKSYNFVH